MDDLFYEADEGARRVFSLLGMPVTAYALCVAAALAMGMLLLGHTCRRQGLKGDTATGATKPAIVETGAQVMVPLFVEIGDKLKIDTRSGEYLSRV